MQLYDNPASPFCRKVQVLAHEAGMMDEIEIIYALGSPVACDKLPTDLNPLGKIPALVDKTGRVLFDSRVICRYLDRHAAGRFYPAETLFDVLTVEALADGIMDAAVLMVYEIRCRDEAQRSDIWIEAQWAKIIRALAALEQGRLDVPDDHKKPCDMGQIAVACACGYLDFRHGARNWRDGHPKLAAWFEQISQRPSLQQTRPKA